MMGPPKVKRNGEGFFGRIGRTLDSWGSAKTPDTPATRAKAVAAGKQFLKKFSSVGVFRISILFSSVFFSPTFGLLASGALMQAVKPPLKKYSPSGGKPSDSKTPDRYVAEALNWAARMRDLAVKEDGVFNRTTPKDVDKVLEKYRPQIAAAPTRMEKRRLAMEMMEELSKTPTGRNLGSQLGTRP